MMIVITCTIVFLLGSASGKNCGPRNGVRQSPIDIEVERVIFKTENAIVRSPDYFKLHLYELINNGETLQLRKTNSSEANLTISKGPLEVPYTFQNIHFHWAQVDGIGSEHTINNRTYALEMHAVHTQDSDSTKNQYAVIGTIFQVGVVPNAGFKKLLPVAISAAHNRNEPLPLVPLRLDELFNPWPTFYFNYQGSLTTPPYTESVNWVLDATPHSLTRSQLNIFREAAKIEPQMQNNYRCPQDLNGRQISGIYTV